MKATVELVGIGNFVRLEDGVSENRLFIKLPNGKELEAIISDEHLTNVVECFQSPPAPESPMEAFIKSAGAGHNPAVFVEEELPSGETALVFGGEPVPTTVAHFTPRKSRLVGVDAAGNPIVHVEGSETLADITGTAGDKDEDGVAQL